jgi:signal transduction histidine kinase
MSDNNKLGTLCVIGNNPRSTGLILQYPDNIDSVRIAGDEQRLMQVMSNFISNAAKFTHKEDQIEVSLTVENNHALVKVTDHGPGIPADKQGLLFVKFKQLADKIDKKLPGSGLGLNISKILIEIQQGTIGFESIPNDHTSFYFKLPVV